MRDGAGEAADGSEFFTLNEGGFGLFLGGDLEDDGGDGLDGAVGVVDGRVADVPEAMLAGSGWEFAFEEMVSDGMALGDLLEDLSEAFEGGELGDGTAEDLFSGKAEGFGLTVVDAQVAELDGIEEGEADGSGLVDGFEFGALSLGLLLARWRVSAKVLRSWMSMATPSQWRILPESSRTGRARSHHQRTWPSRARIMRASIS